MTHAVGFGRYRNWRWDNLYIARLEQNASTGEDIRRAYKKIIHNPPADGDANRE